MAIIGVASIRVRPDLTRFRSELNSELRSIDVELKIPVSADTRRAEREIRQLVDRMNGLDVTIDPDINVRKLRTVDSDLTKFKSNLADVGRTSAVVARQIVATTVKLVAFAVAAGAVSSSLSGTATLVGGLGQAIFAIGAASVGVAAAGLATLAAVAGTVKIGISGVGDAMSAVAEGDAKALAEALKNLSPNARAFVQEIAKLKPLFDQLRLDVQQKLFKNLGTEMSATAKAVRGPVTEAFTGIAEVLNFTTIDVLRFMREASTIKTLRGIGDNIVSGLREAHGAARSLTSALLDIVSAGSDLLPELGAGFESVTAKFAEFIRSARESGKLTQFFREAIEDVKSFGRTIRDVGVGISNIFKIGAGGSGSFLGFLEEAARRFREFTESIGGQLIISDIVQIIRDLSGSFGVFLQALKPVLPVVADFAEMLAGQLGTILEALGPTIADLAQTLISTLGEVLPDLVPFVIHLAEGVGKILKAVTPLLKPLGKLLGALEPLIDPLVELVENLVPPLVEILDAMVPVVKTLAEGLGVLVTVIGAVVDVFGDFRTAAELALDPIGTFDKAIKALITGELPGLEGAGKGYGKVGDSIITGIVNGLEGGQARVVAQINTALQGLLDTFSPWYDDFFQRGSLTWGEVGRGITSEQQAVVDRLQRAALALLDLLTDRQSDFAGQGRSLAGALASGLTQGQQEAINKVRAMLDALLGVLTGRRGSFEQEGREISARLGGGMSANQEAALGVARGIGNAIAGIFGGVDLSRQGSSMMSSLRNGIQGAVGTIQQVLGAITNLIPSWKGPESVDKKLLTPSGVWIMRGLVEGIESEIPMLESSLRKVTDRVEASFAPDSGLSLNGRSTLSITGGLEPTPVLVDVSLNEGRLKGVIDVQIDDSNRDVRRKVMQGVSR